MEGFDTQSRVMENKIVMFRSGELRELREELWDLSFELLDSSLLAIRFVDPSSSCQKVSRDILACLLGQVGIGATFIGSNGMHLGLSATVARSIDIRTCSDTEVIDDDIEAS